MYRIEKRNGQRTEVVADIESEREAISQFHALADVRKTEYDPHVVLIDLDQQEEILHSRWADA